MNRWGVALWLLVGAVAVAGSNGVGTGGLSGFPAPPPVSGSPITPSSVTTSLVKTDVLDAGVALINGRIQVLGDVVVSKVGGNGVTLGDDSTRINWPGGLFVDSNATGISGLRSNQAIKATTALAVANVVVDSATAPTVANGCTGESVTWSNAGTVSFRFDVGATCAGVTSTVITLPATTNCWTCECHDIVSDATLQQAFAGCTTTSFTISNRTRATQAATAYVDNADIQCICRGG